MIMYCDLDTQLALTPLSDLERVSCTWRCDPIRTPRPEPHQATRAEREENGNVDAVLNSTPRRPTTGGPVRFSLVPNKND